MSAVHLVVAGLVQLLYVNVILDMSSMEKIAKVKHLVLSGEGFNLNLTLPLAKPEIPENITKGLHCSVIRVNCY